MLHTDTFNADRVSSTFESAATFLVEGCASSGMSMIRGHPWKTKAVVFDPVIKVAGAETPRRARESALYPMTTLHIPYRRSCFHSCTF